MKKGIISAVLLAVIIVLAYFVVESIMEPVRFNKERDKRLKEVVQNLKDIRLSQMAFKSIHSIYAPTFDTLLDFVMNGEIPIVKMIPDPDDTTNTRTIMDTIAYTNVHDSLFAKRTDFYLESLPLIPFADGDSFLINAGEIERSKVIIQVFEASALNTQILKGLDRQLINNYDDLLESTDRFPGMKVGSMTEASTDGNWE